MKPIYKIAIIGAGTMGQDLAALMVRQKMPVAIKDINPEAVKKAVENIHRRIDGWAARGKIDEYQAAGLKGLLSVAESWDDLQDEGLLVIEAVPEILNLKRRIFLELEANLPKDAIFATNTSSLPIRDISKDVGDKSRVIGMHFFNPPTSMLLVEVIPTANTAPEVREAVMEFAAGTLQKTPIVVKDRAGFFVNVVLAAYLQPALRMLELGRFELKELDRKATDFGWPMGPFALMDKLSLDVCAAVMRVLNKGYCKTCSGASDTCAHNNSLFLVSPVLNLLVKEGRLGEKSGAGFYAYASNQAEDVNDLLEKKYDRNPNAFENPEAIFVGMTNYLVNETARAVEERVVSAEDADLACVYGLGFPKEKGGPLHWADSVGLENILEHLETPCGLLKEKAEKGERFFEDY